MDVTQDEAKEIASEVAGSIDWQVDNIIANPNVGSLGILDLLEGTRPKAPATIRLIEWMKKERSPMKIITSETGIDLGVVLLTTTAQSIAAILEERGFNAEARLIEDALIRSDGGKYQQ